MRYGKKDFNFNIYSMDKIVRWKNFLDIGDNIIYESKLSRIWKHIESDGDFGIVSPFRKNYSLDENLTRYSELIKIVRYKFKLGYIELEGGFLEEGDWVIEKSLFIPNIKKDDILYLGEYFQQYSIIFKDKIEFTEIGTNEISGFGRIITNFIKSGWDKNLQIDSDLTKLFFSKLIKGSHIDECFLLEKEQISFNEMYNRKIQKRYYNILSNL